MLYCVWSIIIDISTHYTHYTHCMDCMDWYQNTGLVCICSLVALFTFIKR